MLPCFQTPANLAGNSTDMSVLDRQRAHLNSQQQQVQVQESGFTGNEFFIDFSSEPGQQFQGPENDNPGFDGFSGRVVDLDPGLENGCVDSGYFGFGFGMNYGIARTSSCPPAVAAAVADVKGRGSVLPPMLCSGVGTESFKKRKADKKHNPKVVAKDESRDKIIIGCGDEDESKITQQSSNSEASQVKFNTDYIHVRARRGQATDSHSLAERARREKISERMKYLQDLVPGCNKVNGKTAMLDEIINYVQSLQRQVEFLSMKLAAVTTLESSNSSSFSTEVFPGSGSNHPTIGASSEMDGTAYLQFNPPQQVVSSSGLEIGINPDMALRRTISTPVSIPGTFIDSSCFNQIQTSQATWDTDLQSLYGVESHQGRSTSFPIQQFTDSMDADNQNIERRSFF